MFSSCVIGPFSTSSTVLNNYCGKGHPCPFPVFNGNVFSVFSIRVNLGFGVELEIVLC